MKHNRTHISEAFGKRHINDAFSFDSLDNYKKPVNIYKLLNDIKTVIEKREKLTDDQYDLLIS